MSQRLPGFESLDNHEGFENFRAGLDAAIDQYLADCEQLEREKNDPGNPENKYVRLDSGGHACCRHPPSRDSIASYFAEESTKPEVGGENHILQLSIARRHLREALTLRGMADHYDSINKKIGREWGTALLAMRRIASATEEFDRDKYDLMTITRYGLDGVLNTDSNSQREESPDE